MTTEATPRPPISLRERWRILEGSAKVTMACAALGFILSLHFTSVTSRNGVTDCSHFDVAKFGLGAVAIIAGFATLREGIKTKDAMLMGIAVLGFAFGALHLTRGLGIIGGPCN